MLRLLLFVAIQGLLAALGLGVLLFVAGVAAIVLRRLGILAMEVGPPGTTEVDGPGLWIGRQRKDK